MAPKLVMDKSQQLSRGLSDFAEMAGAIITSR